VVGVVGLFAVLFLARHLELNVIRTVVTGAVSVLGFALLVIFQPELRRALVRLGQSSLFGFLPHSRRGVTNQILDAVATMSREKVGALIAIQREVGLRSYAEGGVRLDAEVSSALLVTIFRPNTPLHDGAVIIEGDRVVAAGCLFPLTENVDVGSGLGTRHRAAIGVTEDSDAIAIVVSEETGAVSFALKGQITRDVEPAELRMILRSLYTPTPT
jgi:diadenylate cyclase